MCIGISSQFLPRIQRQSSLPQTPLCCSRFRPRWWIATWSKGECDSSIRFAPRISRRRAARLCISSARLCRQKNFPPVPTSRFSQSIRPRIAIADLKTEFSRSGVTLSWTPPEKTLIGAAPNIAFYRVYQSRNGISSECRRESGRYGDTEPANPKVPFARIAEAASPPYTDTQTELGKTYVYSVRSVAQYPGARSSRSIRISPRSHRKTFFRRRLRRILSWPLFLPLAETAAYLDLSWSISAATDIAGYNVYRSEEPSSPGTRVNSELLLTPAFRDMNAVPGRTYFYTVTAIDRSGNESPASPPASGSIPAPDHQ